ncbi:MAG: hypothetical protein C5B56_07395 [Proteobacteria bacterium]|nr:MAG: hypothetical protein C5B56_07395 [Pseudomonadota bacterium]
MKPVLGLLYFAAALSAQGTLDFLNHNRPVLDAHNCYPYKGEWADRITRALGTGSPVGIEQDLAWYVDPVTGKGRIVVSHTDKVTGTEPQLRDYFFERVRPIVEKALAENNRAQWPVIVLHFDFKTTVTPLLHAVWDLLGEYQGWITTAEKSADPHRLTPFDARPLLVLTEDADAQEEVFYKEVPVGAKMRLFGSAHTRISEGKSKEEREHLLATLPPEKLLVDPPTTYRRWWNNSWHEVEEGGQRRAGDWTPADDRRLHALVDHAHRLGYWIRFYTLDGFAPEESKGWDQSYNFGTRDAVMLRWKAALAAGVNLIATDQYEALHSVIQDK